MNPKYRITKASINYDGVDIEFECWSKDIDAIKSSIDVKSDTPIDDIPNHVNAAAYNILTSIISKKEHAENRKNEEIAKKDKCELLKSKIDELIGKEKPVKNLEKKEKK